ncbi:MAG: DUF6531 domain-containing protein, partial [Candidatus Omnitrophica bacterium]|nr:DUF6531 domain-containing protein [Candidatus Omnitrophota bacterium]
MKILSSRKSIALLTVVMFILNCVMPQAAMAYHVTKWWEDGVYGDTTDPSGSAADDKEKDQESPTGGTPGCGDPVYVHTGEVYYECNDLVIPGRGLDVVINHKYRSGKAYNGQFGHVWRMSYYYRIRTLD